MRPVPTFGSTEWRSSPARPGAKCVCRRGRGATRTSHPTQGRPSREKGKKGSRTNDRQEGTLVL